MQVNSTFLGSDSLPLVWWLSYAYTGAPTKSLETTHCRILDSWNIYVRHYLDDFNQCIWTNYLLTRLYILTINTAIHFKRKKSSLCWGILWKSYFKNFYPNNHIIITRGWFLIMQHFGHDHRWKLLSYNIYSTAWLCDM